MPKEPIEPRDQKPIEETSLPQTESPAEPERVGEYTRQPEEIAQYVAEARAKARERRARKTAERSTGAATPAEIEQAYAQAEAAYQPQVPEPEAQEQVREKPEPGLERPDFTKDQMEFALNQVIDFKKNIEKASLERVQAQKQLKALEALPDSDKTKKTKLAKAQKLLAVADDHYELVISSLKIAFPNRLAQQYRELLKKRLGLQSDFDPYTVEFKGEDPDRVEELIKNKRVNILSEQMPFLVLRYEHNPDTKNPEEQFTASVQKLVPHLQRSILEGASQPKDFEAELAQLGERGAEAMQRMHEAMIVRGRLDANDWNNVQTALDVLYDDGLNEKLGGKLNHARNLLEVIPDYGDKARDFIEEYSVLELMKHQAMAGMDPWFKQISPEQQEAVKKYIDTSIDTYAGALNDQEKAELSKRPSGKLA